MVDRCPETGRVWTNQTQPARHPAAVELETAKRRRASLLRVNITRGVGSALRLPFQSVSAVIRAGLPIPKPRDNSDALAAFIAKKTEIDTMLARLIALSSDHFGCDPEAVNWGDVGTLASYLKGLREISDAAFHEGEYAA